jgi:hypothetical protein
MENVQREAIGFVLESDFLYERETSQKLGMLGWRGI